MPSFPRAVTTPRISTVQGNGTHFGPLPFALNDVIGREAHIAAIAARLTTSPVRLLTLIGPGGIGKTRLALEAAQTIRHEFADGVFLIRLASVTDPALVPALLEKVLGIWNAPEHQERWSIAQDRQCLLVIDNFEQLLPAAPVLVDVLSHCPRVRMLVTSRVPLHVSGEFEFPVPPLDVPATQGELVLDIDKACDAVRLFVCRAQAVQPSFALDAGNAAAISRIVRQLDGLPLAIELAAAQTKHLSPAIIADHLGTSGDLLRGGPVDRAPHQRAIRETIAWSYDLLNPKEQADFRCLSVFSGGFVLQAAAYLLRGGGDPPGISLPGRGECVDLDVLSACSSLADKNLISRGEDVQGEPRFSLLFTIRSFGREELRRCGEWEQMGERHAAWYLAFAERAAQEIEGASQKVWLDWLELEHANLRNALAWFRDREDIEHFARMANALSSFWLIHGHFNEGQRWLQSVIDRAGTIPVPPNIVTDLMSAAGWLALRQGSPQLARAWGEASLNQARRNMADIEIAEALNLLAHIEHRFTDYERAAALFRESLGYYEKCGHAVGRADTLTSLATIAMDAGRLDEAAGIFAQAEEATAATGDAIAHARVIDNQGVLAYTQGNAAVSLQFAERALAMYREHGSLRGIGVALDHVGKCARSLGDIERAWACHRESLSVRRGVGDTRGISVWLEAVIALLVSCGRYERAAWALGAVDAIRERGRFPLYGNEEVEQRWAMRCASDHLGPDVFARQWARGAAAPLDEVVDAVFAEAEQAVASSERQEPVLVTEMLAERGLTPREIDVLLHIAMRLTDKEIAGELGISARTVSTHVTGILAKLGVRSRREAAQLVDQAHAGA